MFEFPYQLDLQTYIFPKKKKKYKDKTNDSKTRLESDHHTSFLIFDSFQHGPLGLKKNWIYSDLMWLNVNTLYF